MEYCTVRYVRLQILKSSTMTGTATIKREKDQIAARAKGYDHVSQRSCLAVSPWPVPPSQPSLVLLFTLSNSLSLSLFEIDPRVSELVFCALEDMNESTVCCGCALWLWLWTCVDHPIFVVRLCRRDSCVDPTLWKSVCVCVCCSTLSTCKSSPPCPLTHSHAIINEMY